MVLASGGSSGNVKLAIFSFCEIRASLGRKLAQHPGVKVDFNGRTRHSRKRRRTWGVAAGYFVPLAVCFRE